MQQQPRRYDVIVVSLPYRHYLRDTAYGLVCLLEVQKEQYGNKVASSRTHADNDVDGHWRTSNRRTAG